MLVLTRRIGEVTKLSGGIEVTVLRIQGSLVKLGWIAPAAIKIHREEICKRVKYDSALSRRVDGRQTQFIGPRPRKK